MRANWLRSKYRNYRNTYQVGYLVEFYLAVTQDSKIDSAQLHR